jgi:chromatin remodeling complex protein RSC6
MADNSAGQSKGGTPRDEPNAASELAGDVADAVRAHPLAAAGAAALAAGGLAIAALVQGRKGGAESKAPAKKAAPRKRKPETVAADTEKPRKTAAKSGAAKSATAKTGAAKKSTAKSAGEGSAKPRKTAAKSASGGGDSGKPRGGLAQPVKPDEMLAAVVGTKAAPRSEMTKRLWDYIKKNNLQDAENRRMINADDKLRPIFGSDQVSMFEMTKLVNKHMAAE